MMRPASCSNNRGADRCRGTVTHAIVAHGTALDACARCVREWYSVGAVSRIVRIIRSPLAVRK